MIRRISLLRASQNTRAAVWERKIRAWCARMHPEVHFDEKKPQAVFVLGGDGTMIHAARRYYASGAVVCGLNVGTVGFLASVNNPREFTAAVSRVVSGAYHVLPRMMMSARVVRAGTTVFEEITLNEIAVHNPLGILEARVSIGDVCVQQVRGSGVLVATPTGSTAYNLSAHGPIVVPYARQFIITELLDHDIPTPSIVADAHDDIAVDIVSFRKRGLLAIAGTHTPADALLMVDGDGIFSLEAQDRIILTALQKPIRFAEFDRAHFFKSLREKFRFR